jgi:hypothetical protein
VVAAVPPTPLDLEEEAWAAQAMEAAAKEARIAVRL